jgi:hypothetical protein
MNISPSPGPIDKDASKEGYFDVNPSVVHRCGDIWSDVPSFGGVRHEHVDALVVTPPCDLANRKVETLTLVPIVPVREFFLLPDFRDEIVSRIKGLMESVKIDIAALDFSLNCTRQCATAGIELTEQALKKPNLSAKEKVALERSRVGFSLIEATLPVGGRLASGADMETLLAKELDSITNRIVRNAFRNDCHFLPDDGQVAEWAAVKTPSVALFRYVFSLPIHLFDAAQQLENGLWQRYLDSEVPSPHVREFLVRRRPLKRATIRTRFISDLLTRYANMFVRLGAPNFSDAEILRHITAIKGP